VTGMYSLSLLLLRHKNPSNHSCRESIPLTHLSQQSQKQSCIKKIQLTENYRSCEK
jgi:hypothetical protein